MGISRRDVVLAGLCSPVLAAASAEPEDAEQYPSREEADRWMREYIGHTAVAGSLHVMRFADPYYALTKEIAWRADSPRQGLNETVVPVGFVTDFASIPRVFWTLLPRDGVYTYPAIIHDYLYWDQSTDRADADDIFKLAMREFDVPSSSIASIYSAVRLGGGVAWNGNARAKAGGQRRILASFPDSPTVRWEDWRNNPRAFEVGGQP